MIMWDKVRFGGKISKEEMASLDTTVGKPEDGGLEVDIHRDQYVPDPGLIGKSATLGSVGYEDNHDQSGGGMFSMFTNFSYFVDFMALGSCIYRIYLLFIKKKNKSQ